MNANRWFLSQLFRAGLHVVLDQLGLVVEQLLLRRRAGHVQIDHVLRLGREVRLARRKRMIGRRRRGTARCR